MIHARDLLPSSTVSQIPVVPDLLTAAKQVWADYDIQIRGGRAHDYMRHWQDLHAAIAKAEGRTVSPIPTWFPGTLGTHYAGLPVGRPTGERSEP